MPVPPGEMHAETQSGDFQLHLVAEVDHIQVRSMSGDLKFQHTEALSLAGSTISGNIEGRLAVLTSTVQEGAPEPGEDVAVNLSTMSGSILLKNVLDSPGNCSV